MELYDLLIWKSRCPLCRTDISVYILDKRDKFWKRFFEANNRFACARCNVTWRRKKSHGWSHLVDPDDVDPARPESAGVDKLRGLR